MAVYATRADVELRFGKENVKIWASLDGIPVESDISAKITESIAYAQDEVDGILRKGPYDIPFTTVPTPIKRLTADLAGVWLHQARGLVNVDGDDDPKSLAQALTRLHGKAIARLQDIAVGRFTLDDDSETSMEVKVVTFEIDDDEIIT